LVVSVRIPAECEIHASKAEPLLALIIDIDIGVVNRIITHMDEHIDYSPIESQGKAQGHLCGCSNIHDK
jgi:hypothetical protein